MKVPRLRGNDHCEGTVSIPQEFRDMDWIDRADLLRDWLSYLVEEYNRTIPGGSNVVPFPKARVHTPIDLNEPTS
jgi:hypothetical protein